MMMMMMFVFILLQKSPENFSKLKLSETAVTNQNLFHEEIYSISLSRGNSFYQPLLLMPNDHTISSTPTFVVSFYLWGAARRSRLGTPAALCRLKMMMMMMMSVGRLVE
jgi:hypothetical protein